MDENVSHPGSSSSESDSMTDMEYLRAANTRISKEQHRLSYSDRNSIHEEIHGVAFSAQEESSDLLQSSLAQLSKELEDLVKLDWKNYNTTSSLSAGYLLSRRDGANGTYVNNPDFRLRFLRCEDFDAKKAAIRLMKFMNFILEIFGAFALFRPIKLTDFKRNEMKVLQSGFLQVLPFRDRSGRKVFIWVGDMGMQFDPILRVRQSNVSCHYCFQLLLHFSRLPSLRYFQWTRLIDKNCYIHDACRNTGRRKPTEGNSVGGFSNRNFNVIVIFFQPSRCNQKEKKSVAIYFVFQGRNNSSTNKSLRHSLLCIIQEAKVFESF
jgi:hypothetical protein